MQDSINSIFGFIVDELGKILFYDIYGFPLIVVVLLFGSITFSFYFRFINIRGFKHSLDVIRGQYDNPNDVGQISHFQALTSALSGTIGLGNIAGVAIAVAYGGAGAVFWMMCIALFSMSAKFVSGTLSQMYRKVNSDGSIDGGPMYYLDIGLSEKGKPKLGKFLGIIYAILIIGAAIGGGNMFQSNQSYALVSEQLPFFTEYNLAWLYGIIVATLVGAVIIGGIKRIGKATEKIVPLMVIIYIIASLFIIFTNIEKLPNVISMIFSEAFSIESNEVYGGLIGAIVMGIRRAVFSNEGCVGSASIAHSAAKTDEPVREGIVAMIGPFIDTIIVCFMTASVILITQEKNTDYQIIQKKLQYDLLEKKETPLKEEVIKLAIKQELLNEDSQDQIKNLKINLEEIGLKKDSIEVNLNALGFYFAEPYSDYNLNEKWDKGEPFKDTRGNRVWDKEAWIVTANFAMDDEKPIKEYTSGEDYTDENKNGKYDKGEPFVDKLNNKWDSETPTAEGAVLTSRAFGSSISWFPIILTIVVFLFSYSTMISWYYYADKSWSYLFGGNFIIVLKIIYLGFAILGPILSLKSVIDFSDMMLISAAFPNIIGVMFLLSKLKKALNRYWEKYNKKEFKTYKTTFIKNLFSFKK